MHFTTSAALLTSFLHLHRSAASPFFKPIFFMFPSTCSLHFILGRLCLHFPSTSCTIALRFPSTSCSIHQSIFLRSSQRITIPPHTFVLASLSAAFFNPSMFISYFVFLLSTNFTPHIALTIDLFALLKTATSFSLKQHVSLPYNIADLT